MAANRVLYANLLLLSFAFFVLFDIYLFHLLLIFLLLLPLVSLLSVLPLTRGVRCRLEAEDDIMPKGACGISLITQNTSFLPCAAVRVEIGRSNALGRADGKSPEQSVESVRFPLLPGKTFPLRLTVRMAHCGRVDLTVKSVSVCDMLGLVKLRIPEKNILCGAGSVYVLPELQSRTVETEDAADLGLDSATYSPDQPGGDPSEIHELRDYRPGDALHSVHWKLSSRMNRLIVREFGLPLNPSLHFLLELRAGADADAAESLLGAMLAFSEYLMARGIVHGVSWVGDDGMLHTASITGADALAAAMHELLALPGQAPWSALERFAAQDARQPGMHLNYLFAGAGALSDASERLLTYLTEGGACRRLTLMPDICTAQEAARYHALGCEVTLLSGDLPDEAEEPA